MALVMLLLVGGLLLLALETLLPGLVAGTAGLICLLAAIVIAYNDVSIMAGHVTAALVGASLLAGVFLWFRYFPGSRLGRRFVSEGQVGNLGGERTDLLHQTGTALSNLRPSGIALIGGRRIDVLTEGAMVERGSPVRVVAVEGMRVVVRAVEP